MIVVGMCSSYREGPLVQAAVRSLVEVGLDALYLFEGPAGQPLGDDVPATDYGLSFLGAERLVQHLGRWRTDGRKRNELLQRAKADYRGERFWCVVVDADEVLVNARYLRDRLQLLEWDDERKAADPNDEQNPPWARWPLHLVEVDGAMSLITGRVFRGDLLRSIDISSSVVTNEHGVRQGWGNHAAGSARWINGWLAAIDAGQMIAWPPLPCEPHIVHRSNLRHPARAGLRMSAQELVEFKKAEMSEEGPQNLEAL